MFSSSPVPKDTLSEPPVRCSGEAHGRHYQSGKQNTKPKNIAKTDHGASSWKDTCWLDNKVHWRVGFIFSFQFRKELWAANVSKMYSNHIGATDCEV